MRKTERERLARRDEYRKNHPSRHEYIGTTKDGKPVTQAQVADFENEATIALHESSHVVAAWMLGQPIGDMQFNDGRTNGTGISNAKEQPEIAILNGMSVKIYSGEVPEFIAQSAMGHSISEMQALSLGEKLVHAKEQAFITLAGVFGCSVEASSDNPLCDSLLLI